MNNSNSIQYLTQKEVSKILDVKVTTLNSWRCSKKYEIPHIKLGRVILYPYIEFHEWLESFMKAR